MARYSNEDKRRLMDIPIQQVLTALGKGTVHTGSGMYWSPFREERTPSFHISRDGRQWYDFGEGAGGSVLTLVCRLLGCDGGRAYDFLASLSSSVIPLDSDRIMRHEGRRAAENRIAIMDMSIPFSDDTLLEYARGRGISRDTLERWCCEVFFMCGRSTALSGIGFRNDSDGVVIRTPTMKRCTSSDITTIMADRDKPTDTCMVFEGFFDFLSVAEMENGVLPCDMCVLNSVVNDMKASRWMGTHRNVILMLDNDRSGRLSAEKIRLLLGTDEYKSVVVDDWSNLYEESNDLNEALAGSSQTRERLIHQYQSLWNRTFQMTFRKD